MITSFSLTNAPVSEVSADIFLWFTHHDDMTNLKKVGSLHHDMPLEEMARREKYGKGAGSIFSVSLPHQSKFATHFFVHVGDKPLSNMKSECIYEQIRFALGVFINQARKLSELKKVAVVMPSIPFFDQKEEVVEQITVALCLSSYACDDYRSFKKSVSVPCILIFQEQEIEVYEKVVKKAHIIGEGTNFARHLADAPSNIATPRYLYTAAKKKLEGVGVKVTALEKEKMESLSMGGILSVAQGSDQEPYLVCMEYQGAQTSLPAIALVGKGVAFDTGGINLKPSGHIYGMKYDMCGAAAVMGILYAAAQLKLPLNLIGVTPLVENMPSGKAARPGDVIVHMNGKTTENKNTDAEGRLILSDALTYTEQTYAPRLIIDLATLTGACVVALGHTHTGMMTRNETVASMLSNAGSITGDRVWPLPLSWVYKKGISSDIADFSNIASPQYGGGASVGGVYLEQFVDKTPFVHLDIAGTAHETISSAFPYLGDGATGAGVRLLIKFLEGEKIATSSSFSD